jgi:hypothetical protein
MLTYFFSLVKSVHPYLFEKKYVGDMSHIVVDNISLVPKISDNMVVENSEEVVFSLRTHFFY